MPPVELGLFVFGVLPPSAPDSTTGLHAATNTLGYASAATRDAGEQMHQPVDVTIIIPAYQGAGTIASCLVSVLQATGSRNCQIVVVESSGDEAGTLVARDFPNVHLIRSAERLSAGAARNRGVAEARGRLVFFVDQDCLVPPDWIDRLSPHLDDPAVGAAGGSLGVANPSNLSGIAVFFLEFFRHVRRRAKSYRTDGFLLGCNSVYRADVLRRVAFPDQTLGEDVLFTHAVREAGFNVVYDPTVEVLHHNRTGWGEFFRYNRAMGHAAARLHARLDNAWVRPFLRHPPLVLVSPLAILPLIAWYLARSRYWYLPTFILLLPICLLGNLAWADSFRRRAADLRRIAHLRASQADVL